MEFAEVDLRKQIKSRHADGITPRRTEEGD
jgi:hypothetical protein